MWASVMVTMDSWSCLVVYTAEVNEWICPRARLRSLNAGMCTWGARVVALDRDHQVRWTKRRTDKASSRPERV